MTSTSSSEEERDRNRPTKKDEKHDNDDDVEKDHGGDDRRSRKRSNGKSSSHRHRSHKRRRRDTKSDEEESSSSDDSSSSSSSSSSSDDSSSERQRRKRRKEEKARRRSKRKDKKRRRSRHRRSHREESDDDDNNGNDNDAATTVSNKKLLAKLEARGETLQERQERKAQARAAKIQVEFGYTAQDNPFHDANLHEPFVWKKKQQQETSSSSNKKKKSSASRRGKKDDTMEEIKRVRRRRLLQQEERREMERLHAEEARMKEQEHYEEWMQKQEDFHHGQQQQKAAIRLLQGRERPIDVLAKNVLLFLPTSSSDNDGDDDDDKRDVATRHQTVKYQERYNALRELETNMETLMAQVEEPQAFVKVLTLDELQQLLQDVDAYYQLEQESSSSSSSENNAILNYWKALRVVTQNEVQFLQKGGETSDHGKVIQDILQLFEGQSEPALLKMKDEVVAKLANRPTTAAAAIDGGGINNGSDVNVGYWQTVLRQLDVHLAKQKLSELHEKMLVRQLERLEQKREELKASGTTDNDKNDKGSHDVSELKQGEQAAAAAAQDGAAMVVAETDSGDLEQELGLDDEYDLNERQQARSYSWQDKWRPRKPRYFNRVKTGYDWNKYNQTHYDHDNPPPKTVQGYKFNIFYPDLIDKTKTPQFFIEPADSPEFCILRFHAGPPYEDNAFKIINREWNRSRKRGFRSTFERGVLSLYFNFTTHWYRR